MYPEITIKIGFSEVAVESGAGRTQVVSVTRSNAGQAQQTPGPVNEQEQSHYSPSDASSPPGPEDLGDRGQRKAARALPPGPEDRMGSASSNSLGAAPPPDQHGAAGGTVTGGPPYPDQYHGIAPAPDASLSPPGSTGESRDVLSTSRARTGAVKASPGRSRAKKSQ